MAQMKTRVLGRSGLKVSEFCLGTLTFGAQTELGEAQRIADHAADRGVNFIDTANVYAQGESEKVVGRIIKAKRDHWILASKLAQPTGPGPNDRGLSRRHMIAAVDASLQRLGLDHIDVHYTHRVDPAVSWEDVASTFGDLIKAGESEWRDLGGGGREGGFQIGDVGVYSGEVICPVAAQLGLRSEAEV